MLIRVEAPHFKENIMDRKKWNNIKRLNNILNEKLRKTWKTITPARPKYKSGLEKKLAKLEIKYDKIPVECVLTRALIEKQMENLIMKNKRRDGNGKR